MTDGHSNVNYWDTVPAADDLKSRNVKIIAIGINLDSYDEVNKIASSTDDVYRVRSILYYQ